MFFLQELKITVITISLLCGLLITPDRVENDFPIPPHSKKTLFYIQRSTNKNTVMYEVNLLKNNTLDLENPVNVYWIRYAEKGQKRKLNYIEQMLAYGVNHKPNIANHSIRMYFNASSEKEMIVLIDPTGQAQAQTLIDKKPSSLEKIFVTVTDGMFMPKVRYVEFFGNDLVSNEKTYEKMKF